MSTDKEMSLPAADATGDRDAEFTEADFATLHLAVTLAKDLGIRSAATLKSRLLRHGCTEDEAGRAILFWARYEQEKTPAQRAA